jgi:hypothetical protein
MTNSGNSKPMALHPYRCQMIKAPSNTYEISLFIVV